MKQEVQVVLTLEVDADKSKKDIEKFFYDMEETYTRAASQKNRIEFSKISLVEIKEEAEIYKTDQSRYQKMMSKKGNSKAISGTTKKKSQGKGFSM